MPTLLRPVAGRTWASRCDEVKILLLCYEYPPVGGGGGRVAAQVAARLASRGHQVRAVTAGMRHLPRSEVRENVEILRPPSFRRREDTCTVYEKALYILTNVWTAVRGSSVASDIVRPLCGYRTGGGRRASQASLCLDGSLGRCPRCAGTNRSSFSSCRTVRLTGLASCRSGHSGKSFRRRIGVESIWHRIGRSSKWCRLVWRLRCRSIRALAFLWRVA